MSATAAGGPLSHSRVLCARGRRMCLLHLGQLIYVQKYASMNEMENNALIKACGVQILGPVA